MREIHVIPWHCDFFPALLELMRDQAPDTFAQGDLSDFLVIFPHLRPRRYLRRALLQLPDLPKPCRPPETLAMGQLFAQLRIGLEHGPLEGAPHKVVQRLDRVAVLRDCVATLQAESGLLGRLPADDPTTFIPWGLRLERLLEDFVRQGLLPQNTPYTEEQVQPFAAELLAQLGDIAELYAAQLEQRGWTTPARDAWRVVEHLDQACDQLEGRQVVLAGLSDLGGLEERLCRALWQRGALIVLHSDPALVQGRTHHWSCCEHAALLQRWGAAGALAGSCPEPQQRDLRFVEGFDLHSQLDGLQRELVRQHEAGVVDVTVALPNTALLMPALHHLPDKSSVNISMGYPLARSPLARLVDCLLRLQETARAPGEYYWKDLFECIRHPYLKMLGLPPTPEDPSRPEADLRRAFRAMETAVRSGRAFFAPLQWEPDESAGGWRELAGDADPEALRELFRTSLQACLTAWEDVASLGQATAALQRLCDLLREFGHDLWRRFPIDAECLHRMLYNVIPALGQSSLAQEDMPRETVFAILRQTLEEERAPFESDSLEGVQLLGLLETRLLSPRTVLMLDLTDDALPGPPGNDPLLPDSLRRLVGLPDSAWRERAMAHHFFRLLQGAETAVLFCQQSVEGGGLFDDKRLRSRFLEELLWELEQQKGRVLEPGEPPLTMMHYPVSAPARRLRAIRKTPAVRAALERQLIRGFSPTILDEYLHCPARFFYSRLCIIEEPQDVSEEGEPMEVGALVHKALEAYFAERRFRPLHPGVLDPEALEAVYLDLLRSQEFYTRIPFDQRLMLQKTGPMLLRDYLAAMPDTEITELETEYHGSVEIDGRAIPLKGRADRVDLRGQGDQRGAVVLDYKTGNLQTPTKGFWNDEELWARIRTWPDCEEPEALLPEVARQLKSVQLPCYCHLHLQQRAEAPLDAVLVELRNKGKEHPLIGSRTDAVRRQEIIEEQTPQLLQFLLRHMTGPQDFEPQPAEKYCTWCPHAVSCCGGQ